MWWSERKPHLFLLFPLLILATSCGYRLASEEKLPGGTKRLSISVFDNRSGEIGIETVLANDLVDQFTRSRSVRLVGMDRADAVLTGTIRGSRIRTISHRSPGEASERRITLLLDIVLKTPEGRILWSARGISAADSYLVAEKKLATEQNIKSAIATLSERLAERIYYQLTGSF
jgi:outer membrane lipopolysaccharide assembly protein LptE/RlpB